MDLDGDGRTDVLSGSFPGEIYFFRRLSDDSFAAGETLKDQQDKALNVGHASSAFAVDWDADGLLDLLVGNVAGEVYLIPNAGSARRFSFGKPRRLEAAGQPIKAAGGDAAPVAADWDGDGLLDLILGAEDGSIGWFRNAGSARAPRLDAPRELVRKSPIGWGGDDGRRPGQWGLRVKPCAVDWDGDGCLDLLLGDRCGGFQSKPTQTEEEKREEIEARDQLPGLRQQWAVAFREYRDLLNAKEATDARTRRLDELREEMRRLKDGIVVVQGIQARYQPGYQTHGFVWLFLRKSPESGSAGPGGDSR